MAGLARLSRHCDRLASWRFRRPDRPGWPRLHVLAAGLRLRRAPARGAYGAFAGGCVRRLPTARKRLLSRPRAPSFVDRAETEFMNFIASAIGAAEMESFRIAEHPQAANAQHYELPATFL